MPVLRVIAGANGAGKSTFARMMSLQSIDPDSIAAGYGEGFTPAANLRASRQALWQMQAHLEARQSFTFETTLAARQPLRLMAQATALGYAVHLAFIVANPVEDTRLRIDNRVLQGGHNISDKDLERRGPRILANLPDAVSLADVTAFYLSSIQHQDFILAGAAAERQVQATADFPAHLLGLLSQHGEIEHLRTVAPDHPARAAFHFPAILPPQE